MTEFRIIEALSIQLPTSIQELTEEVGNAAKRKVEFYKTNDPNSIAESHFQDGVPKVGLSDDGMDVYNIAHELCHLRCRIRGFPSTATKDSAQDIWFVSNFCTDLQSIIEHQIIFPELLSMGFNPYSEVEKMIEEKLIPLLRSGFRSEEPRIRFIQLILIYARIILEAKPSKVRRTAENWFEIHARKEKRMGNQIIQKVQYSQLIDPFVYQKAIVECLKILGISGNDWYFHHDFSEHI